MALSAQRFTEFFEVAWGCPPFAWQCALAGRVINDAQPWPQAIALPTGSGKTACIDIAIFALAAGIVQAGEVVRSRAPRRIFFVVDRRVIVDEAFERANSLTRKLADADGGILREVADALKKIAFGRSEGWQLEQPLLTFQLRGGMYRSEAWALSPLQPIVVASTVDQIGSRLLFRAYGRSPGMWPVYAALVANDSLVLLDEAHCARPFMETLQAVSVYRKTAREPLNSPFFPVVLSATPPGEWHDIFRDVSEEPSDPNHPLGKRHLAHKPTELMDPVKIGTKKTADVFAVALAEQATKLAQGGSKAIVIFVNRVATARAVHEWLRSEHDVVLLTGRMRPVDKDDSVHSRLKPLSASASDTRNLPNPIFVVATQTLEVGADLDFDALVTECASLDALRQRFGRLNRKGRPIEACAAILVREDQIKRDDDDPVYGRALTRTWAWLSERAGTSRIMDFGIAYLQPLLSQGTALQELNAPAKSAAVLLPAHLDVLSQTSPIPMPSPEIRYFLRGEAPISGDIQVCWRADFDLNDPLREDDIGNLLSHCPPASAECVTVPISRMRLWLAGMAGADQSSDVEGEDDEENEPKISEDNPRVVIRWHGRGNGKEAEAIADPSTLCPGDIIVIAESQKESADLADLPPSTIGGRPIFDWGDRAFRISRGRALLRLHEDLIANWPITEEMRSGLTAFLSDISSEPNDDLDLSIFIAEIKDWLRQLAKVEFPEDLWQAWRWLPSVAGSLAAEKDTVLMRNTLRHPFGGLILRGTKLLGPLKGSRESADVFSDEDDSTASGTVAVPLAEHLSGVAKFARRFADGAGLTMAQAEAVEMAGRLHDLGKADPRFQSLLRGGLRLGIGTLLAKSDVLPQGRAAFERLRELSGYPEGGRHELLSVRLIEHAHGLLPTEDALRDLILHLVASHHGYCRPLAPVIEDHRPVDTTFELLGQHWSYFGPTNLERLDSGTLQRFWRLTRRHGWWGVAWLEAILRLADHRRSEQEQRHAGE